MTVPVKKSLFVAGTVLWLSATAWGMKWLASYSFTPGRAGAPANHWPADVANPGSRHKSTLVIALHPECPCSRATVRELDSILVQTGSNLNAMVVFPDELPGEPVEKSELYQKVQALAGVRIVADRDGSWLRPFAFRTSGEARLYRPDGSLAFRGGITASRGHEGDNPGQQAVIAFAKNPGASGQLPVQTPVFGCALGRD